MNESAARKIATEPAADNSAAVAFRALRRAVKLVGDVLWYSFLTVVFGSITIGVATELLF